MASPRLNLPIVGTTVTDAQLLHLVRTLREWSRYIDATLITLDADTDALIAALEAPLTITTSLSGPNFVSNRTGAADVDGAIHLSIRSAGTEIGRITRATSSTAGFLTTSDADLKENIVPIDDETTMLWMRITEPLFFNYKDRPGIRHVGYSAQQVAEIWPNAVANGIVTPGHGNIDDRTWDEDGNETTPPDVWQAWMMDHSKLTPVLHAGLRTLDRTIEARGVILDDHDARIAALETTVDEQAALIAAQASQIADLYALVADLRDDVFYTRTMTAGWQFSNTATPPPGAGQLRTNVPFTTMYLHKTDSDGYNRSASLNFIVARTALDPDCVRFRVRGSSGSVMELRTAAPVVDNGTYLTIPVTVLSGAPSDKGFRVEVTLLTEIWAGDPPI